MTTHQSYNELLALARIDIDDAPETETEEVEDDSGEPEQLTTITTKKGKPEVTLANWFSNSESHPVFLDLIVLKKYGPDWLSWEPETLTEAIERDFKGHLSSLNMNKLQACKTMHLSDSFWNRWEVFVWVVVSLNNIYPDFSVMQIPTIPQILIACDCARRIREPVKWSDEVETFAEQCFRFEGVFCPIPPADFIEIDTNDLVVNCEEVARYWNECEKSNKVPKEETIVAEQVRRIMEAVDVLYESKAHLRKQMRLVEDATY